VHPADEDQHRLEMALPVRIAKSKVSIYHTQAHDEEESYLAMRLKPTLTADQK
jgi:hypothetical protein